MPAGHVFQNRIENVQCTLGCQASSIDVQSAVDAFQNPDITSSKTANAAALGLKVKQKALPPSKVTVTVVNHENPYEYAMIKGRLAEDTHDGADENIDKLAKKYLGKDEYPFRQEGEQRVMFRIEPERVQLHGG